MEKLSIIDDIGILSIEHYFNTITYHIYKTKETNKITIWGNKNDFIFGKNNKGVFYVNNNVFTPIFIKHSITYDESRIIMRFLCNKYFERNIEIIKFVNSSLSIK